MSRIERRNNQLPGYKLKTPRKILQTEWRLTDNEKECLRTFALRNWSMAEFLEYAQLQEDSNEVTVRLWNVDYTVVFQVSVAMETAIRYSVIRERSWRDPVNSPQPKLWISFRHGELDGTEFAYAIVQQDNKELKS